MKIAGAVIFPKGTDNFRIAAGEDADDFRFVVAPAVYPLGVYGVAVQGAVEIFVGNEKVVRVPAFIGGNEEREAAFVARKSALDESELFGRAVLSAARDVQRALVAEGVAQGEKILFLLVGNF